MNQLPIFLLIFSTLLLVACEQEEGCLDPEATNYQVSADKDCCCEYQPLRVTLFPQIGEQQYADTLLLEDAAETPFYIKDFRLYLSHFSLIKTDSLGAEEVRILEEMVQVEGERDDVVLLRKGTFSYTLGSVLTNGAYDRIRFYFGLSPTVNEKTPPDFRGHPLAEQVPEMYDDAAATYLFSDLELDIAQDSLRSRVQGNDFYRAIDLNQEFVIDKRESFEIRLAMRLDKYYEGVDFLADDENLIQQKIVNNLDSVFIWKP